MLLEQRILDLQKDKGALIDKVKELKARVTMLEKEAKERAIKLEESQTLGVYDDDEDLARDIAWDEGKVAGYEEGFKDGAEFGYNKANEWHRVSDKLPAMDVLVYLWKKGDVIPVVARRHIFYRQKEWVWSCLWGSGFTISQLKGRDRLWKEITLPKEIEEND